MLSGTCSQQEAHGREELPRAWHPACADSASRNAAHAHPAAAPRGVSMKEEASKSPDEDDPHHDQRQRRRQQKWGTWCCRLTLFSWPEVLLPLTVLAMLLLMAAQTMQQGGEAWHPQPLQSIMRPLQKAQPQSAGAPPTWQPPPLLPPQLPHQLPPAPMLMVPPAGQHRKTKAAVPKAHPTRGKRVQKSVKGHKQKPPRLQKPAQPEWKPVPPYTPLQDWQVQPIPGHNRPEPPQEGSDNGGDVLTPPALGTPSQSGGKGGYVSLCLAVKDQARDMPEWLEWHRTIGVEKIYVFDMGSQSPMNQSLQGYIDSGLVEYYYVLPGALNNMTMKPQLQIYDTCIHEFGRRHSWMGFIDADEFIVLRDRSVRLPDFLKGYQSYGGLALYWVVFGSSGHLTRPAGGVLRSFWKCVPLAAIHSRHVKSLVNLRYAGRPYMDPHTFTYSGGKWAVDELGTLVPAPINKRHTSSKIALHHYVLKSAQEFEEKRQRGSAMQNKKPRSFFPIIDKESTSDCRDGIAAADEMGFVMPPLPPTSTTLDASPPPLA